MTQPPAPLTCPACGERVYPTDTNCMSCGADLHPKAVGPPPVPTLGTVPAPGAPRPPAPTYAPPPAPTPYAAPPPPPYAAPGVPPPPMLRSRPAIPEFAGFWRRFVAAFIDGILLDIVILPLSFAVGLGAGLSGGSTGGSTPHPAVTGATVFVQIVSVVIAWLYYSLMESSQYQATLGKMALGIIVTDLEGNRISFGQATGRFFGKIVSAIICYVGFIMAGFTERKQALHDTMASCLVVMKPPLR